MDQQCVDFKKHYLNHYLTNVFWVLYVYRNEDEHCGGDAIACKFP